MAFSSWQPLNLILFTNVFQKSSYYIKIMYRGFVGTVLSHFLSLIAALWAIFKVHDCYLESEELRHFRLGPFLIAANSALALVRYGSIDGYKLRRLHIITLNLSAILNFAIGEFVFLLMNKSSSIFLFLPFTNIIPLVSNIFAKDYRTKIKHTDFFIALNCLFFLLNSFLSENYYGVALSLSFFFGYFVVGETGYFLDTEVPSVDAFQYLTCFLNFFTVYTFCY